MNYRIKIITFVWHQSFSHIKKTSVSQYLLSDITGAFLAVNVEGKPAKTELKECKQD